MITILSKRRGLAALTVSGSIVGVVVAGVTGGTAATAAPALAPTPAASTATPASPSPLGAGPDETFTVRRVVTDRNGASHVRYNRTYRGLAVRGGDVVIHSGADGTYRGASNSQAVPMKLQVKPDVGATDAAAAARARFTGTPASASRPTLLVDVTTGTPRLAWQTVVTGMGPDGQTPSTLHVVSDARSGAVISSFDEVEQVAGTGSGVYSGTVSIDTTPSGSGYQLQDPAHGNGTTCDMNNTTSGSCTVFTDADNTWGTGTTGSRQSAAVDAHFGAAKTFDYYKSTFGRNGIFGDGHGVASRVHYGSSYANAFWDGAKMTYGDGTGNARPLVSLDVAGHEMSHGVTQALAALTYSGEAGGLNEATSDIFGSMVEFYAAAPNEPGNYQIGEKDNVRGDGKPLRYLYNPSLDGSSDSCWSSGTAAKNVHYSSGVANHFFFLLAEGSGTTTYGTSPVCNGAPAVTAIGRGAAAAIWYHALDAYFTSSTRYKDTSAANNDARNYTLRSAADLYGSCSAQYRSVQAAWTAVNVAGEDAGCGASPSPSPTTTTPTVTPTTTTPTTTPTPTPTPTVTPSPATATCRVVATVNAWNTGLTENLTVTNTGSTALNGWSLTFTLPAGQSITSGWNAAYAPTSGKVTATNAAFNGAVAPGASVSVGFQATHTGNAAAPTGFALNGTACSTA